METGGETNEELDRVFTSQPAKRREKEKLSVVTLPRARSAPSPVQRRTCFGVSNSLLEKPSREAPYPHGLLSPPPATHTPHLALFRTYNVRRWLDTISSSSTAGVCDRATGARNWRAICANSGERKDTIKELEELQLRHHPIQTLLLPFRPPSRLFPPS